MLQTLAARGPLHGYALTAAIQEASARLLRVEEGSLYPALHRLEQDGWLRSAWGATDKQRDARFYRITRAGQAQLARERERWATLSEGVQRVLRYA